MVKNKEMICQNALEDVLMTEFSKTMFSLDGYDEDAVCLKKDNDYWEVYIGNRGQKNERMVFDNIVDACLGVIQLLTPFNEPLRARLNNMFVSAVIPDKIA